MPLIDSLLATRAPWASATRTWPLTAFELFTWLDDRPRFPLVFQIDLRFEGPVDVAAMRDAFRFALGRHPLLRALITCDREGFRWHAPATGWAELEILPHGPGLTPEAGWIDLTAGPGLQGRLRPTGDGSDVTLVFHHACCDGQGARTFIQDLALAYAVLRGVTTADTLPALDAVHLDRRGTPVGPTSPWGGVRHLVRDFRTRPRPVACDIGASTPLEPQSETIGYRAHTFDRDLTRRLQDPRRLGAASFNDVAVALLFTVLEDWQRDHGIKPGAPMRISVPVDMRGRKHERMPAANHYAYVFVNRRMNARRDWESLLEDTRNQLRSSRRTHRGRDLLSSLELLARCPRLLGWGLRRGQCLTTAVLTNLSDPSRRLRKRLPVDDEGCLWLDRARCCEMVLRYPPLRPFTRWGVGIFEYAGRVTVTFRYESASFSAAAAKGVLAAYVDGWQRWLETTPFISAG